jgi:rubrerythrin
MASIKGTKTEKNLLAAFAGESQARNRYTFFASQAKKEGFEHIAAVFTETAENEMLHAKRFFKFLEGGDVEITASYPAGTIGTTLENLKASAAGENHEHTYLYPEFARVAKEEGFAQVSEVFKIIAGVEVVHERRFLALVKDVEAGTVFKKSVPVKWRCKKCGYVTESAEAPDLCPACLHPKAHFEPVDFRY